MIEADKMTEEERAALVREIENGANERQKKSKRRKDKHSVHPSKHTLREVKDMANARGISYGEMVVQLDKYYLEKEYRKWKRNNAIKALPKAARKSASDK